MKKSVITLSVAVRGSACGAMSEAEGRRSRRMSGRDPPQGRYAPKREGRCGSSPVERMCIQQTLHGMYPCRTISANANLFP